MQHYIMMAVGIMVKENNDLNELFVMYEAEENPIKKGLLLNMYNNALQHKQKEVISRGDFVR